jgi:UDP-N-acetylglucosamine--N-acetylmuramyl-(pentapeptide) pyrophosphoryl-undecaprenol N-acetylglucosamine transferase
MLAVADALAALAPSLEFVFVGTERGLERRLVPERGYALELVRVQPMRGAGLRGALRGAAIAGWALPESLKLLRRHRPRVVFSVGGYAAGPVALAAFSLGIPVALLEPNADIGFANRLIAPWVKRAYTAFPEAARFFRGATVLETGVPLRAGFEATPRREQGAVPELLVLGGSQGAKTLNEAVPQALARLRSAFRVTHQCGAAHEAATRALYTSLGLEARARVVPFIEDVPAALANADLVIGRAGASATSEICAVGRPSLLVPYPYAGDHQRYNAFSLEQRGAALTVLSHDATPERLAHELEALLSDPERLDIMAESARRLGRPRAAEVIARDLLSWAGLGVEVTEPTGAARTGRARDRLELQEVS